LPENDASVTLCPLDPCRDQKEHNLLKNYVFWNPFVRQTHCRDQNAPNLPENCVLVTLCPFGPCRDQNAPNLPENYVLVATKRHPICWKTTFWTPFVLHTPCRDQNATNLPENDVLVIFCPLGPCHDQKAPNLLENDVLEPLCSPDPGSDQNAPNLPENGVLVPLAHSDTAATKMHRIARKSTFWSPFAPGPLPQPN
jgi:hypothetical protein